MMSVLRRIAMGIGGTAVVAVVIGLAAPKTVHAVVSALVTVTNTTSNPVPTQSVDNPVLQAFQATDSCVFNSTTFCQSQNPNMVPLGMTAVVQNASGHCDLIGVPAPSPIEVSLGNFSSQASNFGIVTFPAVLGGTSGGFTSYVFGGQTTFYGISTSAFQSGFQFLVFEGANTTGTCNFSISGYYVKNGL